MQQRTIEYCAEKDSSERFLVPEILRGRDLWGVRMIEPEYFRRVRHGSDGVTGWVDPSERGGVREWGGTRQEKSNALGQRVINTGRSNLGFVVHGRRRTGTKLILDPCASV